LSAVVSANADSLDDQIDARRALASAVNSAARNTDGPTAGESDAHWKRTDDRSGRPPSFLKRFDQRLQSLDAAIGRH
jgi:hypothetical protein